MEPRAQLLDRLKIVGLLLCWVMVPACVGTIASEQTAAFGFIDRNNTALRKQGGFLLLGETKVNAWLVEVNEMGDTLYKCLYKNGKAEGLEIVKHPNGELAGKRYYQNGKKEGTHWGWYDNGKPKFEYNYKNDIYEGSVKEWMPTGQLYKHFNYKNGQEEGRQKMWYDNGKIRANYDVKNGRKYGLTGVKNCINTIVNENQ